MSRNSGVPGYGSRATSSETHIEGFKPHLVNARPFTSRTTSSETTSHKRTSHLLLLTTAQNSPVTNYCLMQLTSKVATTYQHLLPLTNTLLPKRSSQPLCKRKRTRSWHFAHATRTFFSAILNVQFEIILCKPLVRPIQSRGSLSYGVSRL